MLPPYIIQNKTMNTFFRHRRTQTSQGQSKQCEWNVRRSEKPLQNLLSCSSVETILPSSTQNLKKIQGNQTQPISKLTVSQVTKSKYSRFPREEDFLLKTLKKPSNNLIQPFKIDRKLPSKTTTATLQKKMKKMDSLQCFPQVRDAPQQNSNSTIPKLPKAFPTLKKSDGASCYPTVSKETKSPLPLSESELQNVKLKETSSTLNLKEPVSDVENNEDSFGCSELSFEIDQLLNGDETKKQIHQKQETHLALRELEALLDF